MRSLCCTLPATLREANALLVEGCLLSGDTLFIDGCGRTDFPGGDSEELFWTLSERLAQVSDETVFYPGHLYSKEASLAMGDVRARNPVFSATSLEQWLVMFGRVSPLGANDHVVVVGAGLAGWRFTEILRQLGYEGARHTYRRRDARPVRSTTPVKADSLGQMGSRESDPRDAREDRAGERDVSFSVGARWALT